jgi:predicted flap endonuclease-1-like 5' DNA nuclease
MLVAQHEEERSREVEVSAEAVEEDDTVALQAWRLRYFEQRVRYLEGLAAAQGSAEAREQAPAQPLMEWRARDAEARAAHLEQELRTYVSAGATAPELMAEAQPFAADADIDALLRWRLLYLERRVAHLQGQLAQAAAPTPSAQPAAEPSVDPDRWKWRARYLEARVRHLEQQPGRSTAMQPAAAPITEAAAEAPPRPSVRGEKPPVLPAARGGAPDDLTLIEDVSVLQQTTLYSIGVFHFDQIADWTPANVAWVDAYLRLRGRIDAEQWIEQARELVRNGVSASRRVREEVEA